MPFRVISPPGYYNACSAHMNIYQANNIPVQADKMHAQAYEMS